MTSRLEVVTAARGWLETPFHHQARLKGVGVDCAGLVIGVARELGIVPTDFDVDTYPRTPDGRSLLRLTDLHMTRMSVQQSMRPGDVVVVSFDKDPQHLGIVGDYRHGGLSIIHAAGHAGRVIETRLLFGLGMKFVAAYSLPGVK